MYEVASHFAAAASKQRERTAGFAFPLVTPSVIEVHGVMPSKFGCILPLQLNFFENALKKHVQKCFSWVFLSPVKLTLQIYHHGCFLGPVSLGNLTSVVTVMSGLITWAASPM